MVSTVSTRKMVVKGEDQGSRRWDHGWKNSMVSTREMVVESRREDHG